MRAFFPALVLSAAILVARGGAATSQNYAITTSVISGGGGTSVARSYSQLVSVAPVGGKVISLPIRLYSVELGFIGQMNNPPIPANDLRSHPREAGIELSIASLLSNDQDVDLDPITLFAVSPTSAAGGTVTLTPTAVNYAPPIGFFGVDSFQYSVRDIHGDFSSATVTLVTAPPVAEQDLNTILLVPQGDGSVLLRFRQQAGSNEYIIERTESLTEPDWQTAYVARAGSDGIVEFLINPREGGQAFFRALVL